MYHKKSITLIFICILLVIISFDMNHFVKAQTTISTEKIVFASNTLGDIEIFSMNPDGSDLQRLTEFPGNDNSPSWSPDGTEIAYCHGSGSECQQIRVMPSNSIDINGQSSRVLATGFRTTGYPRWSKDGEYIFFQAGGGWNLDIYRVPSDGSEEAVKIIERNGPDLGADISPDGTTIVFGSSGGIPTTNMYDDVYIYLMDINGGNIRPLLSEHGEKILGSAHGLPRWSPRGDRIAFGRYDSGTNTPYIFTVKSDGTDERMLVTGNYVHLGTWSPDGSMIAFSGFEGYARDIHVINSDGSGTITNISNLPGKSDAPDWHSFNHNPDCSQATPSIDIIWPPNHKFVKVSINNLYDIDGDSINLNIDEIYQDEPVNYPGSGNFNPDAYGIGNESAQVRAERNGNGNGRVYHIYFTASDNNGGSCSSKVLVQAPKSKKVDAIDEGPLFSSTESE